MRARPGHRAEIVENRPEAGALVLSVDDRSVALGHEAAGKVLVTVDAG